MEDTDRERTDIENLLNASEEHKSKEILATIWTALVGRRVFTEVQQCATQQNAAMVPVLEAELDKIIQKPDCTADDAEIFSTTLNYMVGSCGYNLNNATPFLLLSAANNDNTLIVLTLLLNHNANFNDTSETNHENILHVACRLKSPLRYAYVLMYPSLLALPDINGHLPVHVACQNDDIQFLSWLFRPILCSKGATSTHSCPVTGSSYIESSVAPSIAPPLSSMKYVKLTATTLTGHSVFHIAVSQGYSELLGLLLDVLDVTCDVFEREAVVAPDFESKATPLRVAISHRETECVSLLLQFLSKHGLLETVVQDTQIVKVAAMAGDVGVMKQLVKYGFNKGLEDAIAKVQDQSLKRLLLFFYTQLTSLQAIMDSQSDYRAGGLKAGRIQWSGISLEELGLPWVNDCYRAMESVAEAIRRAADASTPSLYDLCTTLQLASECLNYFESGALCNQQQQLLAVNPLIPITVIEITRCSLKSVPPELFRLPSLEVLKLSSNCIKELPTALGSPESIYASQSLKTLVLDDNQLRALPEDLCLGLVNSLNVLSLQKNELSELPPGLWVMPHLKNLNLSENKLTELHYFCSDSSCNDQNISETIVKTIRNSIMVCDLETKKCKNVSLESSNEPFFAWTYIKRLEVLYRTLHLATYGKFVVNDILEWICLLYEQRLNKTAADKSEPEKESPVALMLSEDFDMSVLHSLNLSHNLFTKIPSQLPCLAPNLQNLYFSYNQVELMDLVHTLPRNLQTVHLDHNRIKGMATPQPLCRPCSSPSMALLPPQPIGAASNCTHTTHTCLKSLAVLMLGYNRLTDFVAYDLLDSDDAESVVYTFVLHFPRLSILSLEHNLLTDVPLSLTKLTSLNSLNLAHNVGIVSLPEALGFLSLSSLNLEGLSLGGIPINLVQKLSPRYLLSYLKGIVQGKELYRRMKLMLVGSANAGKTTLLLELTKKGKMVHQRPVQIGVNGLPLSTVGVELGEWECSFRGLPAITFMTWDFGGQEEYYATHQCFLSHRSLYLVIWDTRDGETGLRKIKTWLENIEARAPGAPVIVVGTHADCINNTSALDDTFKKLYIEYNPSSFAYPNVQHRCFFVNSFNSHHMKELREYLYLFTQSYKNPDAGKEAIPIIDEPVPLYYLEVLKAIQTLVRKCSKQNIIPIFSKEEYLKELFSTQYSGNVQEIVEASSFWHDNGIILHHKGITMDEIYCIDPQWLCATMANVITVQERNPFQKNGFMQMEDFVRLFSTNSTQSFIDAIISIMQSFEVILLLDQQSILIPSLMSQRREQACAITQDSSGKLSVQAVIGQIATPLHVRTDVLVRHYLLPFVPNGFFARLVSRICANSVIIAHCNTLYGSCEPRLLCWRKGLCLVCHGVEVLTVTPVTYPLLGTDSIYVVTSAGHEVVKKFCGVEVRVLAGTPLEGGGSPPGESSDGVHSGAWLLQQTIECIDSIFDDWYIAFGKRRGFDLSMIVMGAPCDQCEARRVTDASSIIPERSVSSMYRNDGKRVTGKSYFVFSLPFCTHTVALKKDLQCPLHATVIVSKIAPDLVFMDLSESMVVDSNDVVFSSLLGRGGFGAVFSGTVGGNNSQRVAIKTFVVVEDPLAPAESLAWEKYQQASREARVMGKLVHGNILGLMGVALAPLMLLLELAPLGDLKACIEKFQQAKVKLNVRTLITTLLQVAKALNYVHSQKFVFRDLKPGNILVWKYPIPESQWNSDMEVQLKLADYGICQQYTPQGVKGAEGTPPYLPPEVLLHGGQQTHSTKLDVYSFGMLMYFLFTFENPFYNDTSRPIRAFLEEGKRPSLSLKQCPPTLGLLELMCWCWSEHPYHRPELDEIIARLENVTTSHLVTVFPILDSSASINAVAGSIKVASKNYTFSLSLGSEKQGSVSSSGYLNPFGNTNKSHQPPTPKPQVMALDLWCGSKSGLKHINCQATSNFTEDIEPSEKECFSIISTADDHIWVSREASNGGGQLSIYDTKKNIRIAKWNSKDCITKLLYSAAKEIVVGTTASGVHIFSDRNVFSDTSPLLSQPYAEAFTQVILVDVAGNGCEVNLWYAVQSRLKALRISPEGITSETFRLYATSVVERMEPLGKASDGKLKHLAVSHLGCIEKWDVDTREVLTVCNCYDLCGHLCKGNYDHSKIAALLYWKDVLFVGTKGGHMLALSPVNLAAFWVIQATEISLECLSVFSLNPQDGKYESQHSLPEEDSETTLMVGFGGQYTGTYKGSNNVPPSLNGPGESDSGFDPHMKLLTAPSQVTHVFVWSLKSPSQGQTQREKTAAKPPQTFKHRTKVYCRNKS